MPWAPFAERIDSPNFSTRGAAVVGALQHSTVSNWTSALTELTRADSSPVSAHFLIGLDGRIAQLVDTDKAAWHGVSCNTHYIGIEHVDNGQHWDSVRTPMQYAASARVNKWCGETHGYVPSSDTLLPHWICVATACPSGLDVERIILETIAGGDMTGDQVKALIREMLDSEEGANLVKTAILRFPNGYGVALDAMLRSDYVRHDGVRAALAKAKALPNQASLRRLSRAKVRAGHGRAKKEVAK